MRAKTNQVSLPFREIIKEYEWISMLIVLHPSPIKQGKLNIHHVLQRYNHETVL